MIAPVALSTLANSLATQARVVDTAASNIVTMDDPGAPAQRGQVVSRVPAGVGYVALPPAGTVDLGHDVADLVTAKSAYGAAAKAFGQRTP